MNLPVVVIVGRPNVGKSALFNRIVGKRVAIVHEQAGVTRDRVASVAEYDGKHFLLVDTGGLGVFLDAKKGVEMFDALIREQVEAVLKEAEAVIFAVNHQDGITPLDREIAQFLRKTGRRVVVAVTKADTPESMPKAHQQFLPLGFDAVEPTSSVQGLGISDLVMTVTKEFFPMPAPVAEGDEPLQLAVVGRPNAGKSSLVNALLGQKRMIVSEVPGTTRDAVDIAITLPGPEGTPVPAVIIDTAGLRPTHKVDNVVEKFSVMRSENAIKRADIVLLMIDTSAPPTQQDRRIASLIGEIRKPCIMVANKIDLLPPKAKLKDLEASIRYAMPHMSYAPIVAVSAKERKNLDALRARIARLYEKMKTTIPTAILNQFLRDLTLRTPPPAIKGRHLKLMYTTMIDTPPPHLVMFVNHEELGTNTYIRFLESKVQEAFFPEGGMPVMIELRGRTGKEPEERGRSRNIRAGEAPEPGRSADSAKKKAQNHKDGVTTEPTPETKEVVQ
jgi:GTP-binding protein